MNKIEKTTAEIIDSLPANLQDLVEALAQNIFKENGPLKLILVGAFTVGKSSLVNMLLGERLLQAALEETTALPTFIEYGAVRSMQLVGIDQSVLQLDDAGLARVTTRAPEGAAYAAVALPHDWLQGVSVIDLPGLGGMTSRNKDYTLAQIQQADAILYLIPPQGANAADIALLKQIRQYGKRVKIVAAQWDRVEEAVADGEKMPSLEEWAAQIASLSGIKARIAPVSKAGLGRDELLDFIGRACHDIADIRRRRFRAELRPVLENALGQNEEAQRACEANSDESVQALQTQLLEQKQALLGVKTTLYARAQKEQAQLEDQSSALIRSASARLGQVLGEKTGKFKSEADWDQFATIGADVLRTALSDVAHSFSTLSAGYCELKLPDVQVAALNLRLPPVEPIAIQDFFDMGRLSRVQTELAAKQAEYQVQQQKLEQLPTPVLDAHQQELSDLMHSRNQLAAQPLPRILQQVDGGSGAMFGRMLGEVADIGLLFVNPAVAGAKVASLIGKGAKVANMAVKTAKVAQIATKGVKVAQAVQNGQRVRGVPQQAIDKLGMLEVLSLGYWGERIGAALGGGPSQEEIIDPQAQAEQAQILAEMDARARAVRVELARNEDIANEHELTGWALEQNRKEQGQLNADVLALGQQIEQRQREFEEIARVDRKNLVTRYIGRAVEKWQSNFEEQAGAMQTLLRARIRSYWDDQVNELLAERLAGLEILGGQIVAAPAEKEMALNQLRQDAIVLQSVASELA